MRAVAFAAALAVLPATGHAETPLDDPTTHSYMVMSQDVTEALRDFGASVGLSMTIDPGVSGRISNLSGEMTARAFLDRLTQDHGLVWYYDGASVHVTPVDRNRSVLLDFNQVDPAALMETLDALAVFDERFAPRAAGEAGIGVITGPPRYVELLENTFALLAGRGDGSKPGGAGADMLVVRGDRVQLWRGRGTPSTEGAPPQGSELADETVTATAPQS